MKKTIIILLLSIIIFKCQAQSNSIPQHFISDKNPGISFTLSALLPGAGEMYNDQVVLGLVVFASDIALISTGTILRSSKYTDATNTFGSTLIVAGALIYAAQLVYAPLFSQKLNKIARRGNTSMELNLKGSQIAFCLKF